MNRFRNSMKSRLVQIHNNLYLDPDDPLFFEKVLRYADPKSPEAHLRLAEKYEREGSLTKALQHYQEAAQTGSNPYSVEAKLALRRLQPPVNEESAKRAALPIRKTAMAPAMPGWFKRLVVALLVVNTVLLLLLLHADKTRAVEPVPASAAGADAGASASAYDPSRLSEPSGIALPSPDKLANKDDSLQGKEASYPGLSAEAGFDPLDVSGEPSTLPPETIAGANLVRTALTAYQMDKGTLPDDVQQLIGDYPDNYLSFIPVEVRSGSNHVSSSFDGTGGWVYRPDAGQADGMFYPNMAGNVSEGKGEIIPYEPVQVQVSKSGYSLQVISGKFVLADKPVGLGKEDRTPEGVFAVEERVLKPSSKQPGAYGEAGLGMGRYAIHGTSDDASISANRSLGCIRLHNEDILDLFDFVPKGAKVKIQEGPLPQLSPASAIDSVKMIPPEKPPVRQTSEGKIFHWLG